MPHTLTARKRVKIWSELCGNVQQSKDGASPASLLGQLVTTSVLSKSCQTVTSFDLGMFSSFIFIISQSRTYTPSRQMLCQKLGIQSVRC
jgi:hypothetical protein